MISEALWEQWTAAQRKALRLLTKRKFPDALAELTQFLCDDYPSELQAEILAFRSVIYEKMGHLTDATNDLEKAHSLSKSGTYQLYTIQLSLGRLAERMLDIPAAASWYLRAIETAKADPSTSGASAIKGLLKTSGLPPWNSEAGKLCERVLKQAWALFALPGEADLENIEGTLERLTEASLLPLPQARGTI